MKEQTACIAAFQNEEESVSIGNLVIENRLDRVSIFGDIDITRDVRGRELAFALKHHIDCIVKRLKEEDLPELIEVENVAKTVANPFE